MIIPNPNCPACRGRLLITKRDWVPMSDAPDEKAGYWYSTNEVCGFCVEWNRTGQVYQATTDDAAMIAAGVPRRFASASFDSINAKQDPIGIQAFARGYGKSLADRFHNLDRNSTLYHGAPGTSKTTLAACIMREALRLGYRARFVDYADFMASQRPQSSEDREPNDTLDAVKRAELLVIDDLGKTKESDWTMGIFYQLVNHRYRELLPTVITTNLHPRSLPAFIGSAAASRVLEFCAVRPAPDKAKAAA